MKPLRGLMVIVLALAVGTGQMVHSSEPEHSKGKSAVASSASASSVFSRIAAESDAQMSPRPGGLVVSSELVQRDVEDLAAYVKWQREFARQSWDWHLFSTKMLMYVVLSIVGFGLLVTYLQFTRDGGRRVLNSKALVADNPTEKEVAGAVDVSPGATGKPSTVKIGPGGLEVTSQVIGLLVLGLSLAFFYLYVKIVYPMQEVELQRHAQAVSAPSETSLGSPKP